MEKGFWVLLNKVYKKDLELLYGDGSSVDFTEIFYHKRKRMYIFKCKLNIGDTNLYQELGETGLNYLIQKSLSFMGMRNEKIMIHISFDLL